MSLAFSDISESSEASQRMFSVLCSNEEKNSATKVRRIAGTSKFLLFLTLYGLLNLLNSFAQ